MEEYMNLSNFVKKFYIPSYVLTSEAEPIVEVSEPPESPILVFINSKSGGQLGSQLILTYRTLNPNQIIYTNLERLKDDSFACKIRDKLKIIVAGGNGTAGWLLGVVSDLKISYPPPIATVPLGRGNNFPFAFGWGKRNSGTGKSSVESFLEQVINAKEMKIEKLQKQALVILCHLLSYHILFIVFFPSEQLCKECYHTFRGGFWNYLSLDAQVSYALHKQRKLHPEKYNNQLVNQLSFTQGWFCAPVYHSSSQNIAQLVKVKICDKSGQWNDLHIPQRIRSIVCLNLPSFSGGLTPWGTPNPKKQSAKSLTPSYVDDGLIEIVGFRDAWHGLVLLAPKGHGTRLAQASQIQFEFKKGAAKHVYMRMDGEPWKQPLPLDDETVIIEISHHGQVNMLATNNCRSQRMFSDDEYQDES